MSGALGDIAADKHHAAMAGAAALQAGDRTMLAEAALARASYALAGVRPTPTRSRCSTRPSNRSRPMISP